MSVDRDEAAVRTGIQTYWSDMDRQAAYAALARLAEQARRADELEQKLDEEMVLHGKTKERAEQYAEVLRYYASPERWRTLETMGTCSANLDRGMRARGALARREARDG